MQAPSTLRRGAAASKGPAPRCLGAAARRTSVTRLQSRRGSAVAAPSAGVRNVLDAIKRSPLMLDLPPGHPGLSAVANLPDDVVVAACVYLMRQHGFGDAKEMIYKDVKVLVPAAQAAGAIEAAKAAARAADALAAESGADGPSGWGNDNGGPRPTGEAARVLDALKRSPLMLTLPAGARALDSLYRLSDDELIGATVVLLRQHGLMDAKAMVAADVKVLLPAATEAVSRWEADAAERASDASQDYDSSPVPQEYAAVLDALKRSPLMLNLSGNHPGLDAVADLEDAEVVGATVVLLREHGLIDAKAMVAADVKVLLPAAREAASRWESDAAERAADAAAAAVDVPNEYATVLDALKRSPLMLTLPGNHPGLDAVSDLSDDAVIGATVVLLRQHGLMDAKAMVADDVTILVQAAQEARMIEAEEAAARAALLAAADADGGAAGWGGPTASAPSGPRPTGEAVRVLDAIKRSPLSLDIPANAPGLSAVYALDDDMIIDSCVLLMRVEGMFDAKEMVRDDPSILVDVSEEVERIRSEEAAKRAADEAAAGAQSEVAMWR